MASQLWIKCLHFFTKIKGGTGFGPPTVVYCFLIRRSIRFLLIETNHVHARNHITIFPIPQRFCMSEPSPSKITPTNPLDHNSCVEKAIEKVKIGFAYPLLSMLWCSKPSISVDIQICWRFSDSGTRTYVAFLWPLPFKRDSYTKTAEGCKWFASSSCYVEPEKFKVIWPFSASNEASSLKYWDCGFFFFFFFFFLSWFHFFATAKGHARKRWTKLPFPMALKWENPGIFWNLTHLKLYSGT